jgi:hypothetical protein
MLISPPSSRTPPRTTRVRPTALPSSIDERDADEMLATLITGSASTPGKVASVSTPRSVERACCEPTTWLEAESGPDGKKVSAFSG